MTTRRQFEAVIGVVDRTAGPLRQIQMRLAGLSPAALNVAQRVRYLGDRLRELAERPDIARIGRAARNVGEQFGALTRRVALLSAGIVGLGAAATVGLTGMVRAVVDEAGRLDDVSQRLGITVKEFQELAYSARLAGVESDGFATAMERLQRGIQAAATGRNARLAELFRRNGIALRDSEGNLRSSAALMPQIADLFRDNENASLRTAMAMEMFGRAGGLLMPMLTAGSDALREQAAEWQRLSGGAYNQTAPALAALGDTLDKVGIALLSVRNVIVERLVPALTPLLEQLAGWISANREIVAARTVEWVAGLAERVREFSVNLPVLLDRMERWAAAAKSVWDALDGLKGVLIIIGAVAIAPLVAAVAGLMLALGKFGLIAAGIVGLGYGLYKAWEPLRQFFEDLFKNLGDWAQAAWERMRPAVDGARALLRAMEGRGTGSDPQVQEERRKRFGGRAQTYQPPGEDTAEPPQLAPLPPPPGTPDSPVQRQSFRSLGPAPQDAEGLVQRQAFRSLPSVKEMLEVHIRLDGLPWNGRVDVKGSRGAPDPQVDVGLAAMGVP